MMAEDSNPIWRKNLERYLSETPQEERETIAREQTEHHINLIVQRVENLEISKGEAALEVNGLCDVWGVNIPEWVRAEIARAWYLYKNGRSMEDSLPVSDEIPWPGDSPLPTTLLSLEECFKINKKTNKSRLADIKRDRIAFLVYIVLHNIHEKGYPIDERAFDVVGEILSISGGQANKYYQEIIKDGHPMLSSGARSKKATKISYFPDLSIPEIISKKIDEIYMIYN